MQYELRLSHGLYNAGLLGLIRILEAAGKGHLLDYNPSGDTLTLDTEGLEGFEDDYYTYFKGKHGEGTITYKLIQAYKTMDVGAEGFEDQLKKWEKDYVTRISQKDKGPYNDGYVIVKETLGDDFDVYNHINYLKDQEEKDAVKRYALYQPIIDYLDRHRDIFIYKNLAHTILESYWGRISFFHRDNKQKDMSQCYKEYFLEAIKRAIPHVAPSGKYECHECFTRFKKNQVEATGTWIKDMGVDYKRKPSHYWDFKVHETICPVCKLVYSCVPAGFFTINWNGLFINVNSSIKNLKTMNNSDASLTSYQSYEHYQEMSYGQVLRHVGLAFDQTIQTFHLTNIQIIRREGTRVKDLKYHMEHLGHLQLHLLKCCEKDIGYYKHRYYERYEQSHNIYTALLKKIANGENLYDLIAYLTRTPSEKSKYKKTARLLPLLNIQTAIDAYRQQGLKGVNKVLETSKKKTYVMYQKGLEMRKSYSPLQGKELEDKLKGLIYQLTNGLQARNKNAFIDRILRLYTSQSKAVPTLFLEMLNDEALLMNYGYAYIIGLKGEEMKKEA